MAEALYSLEYDEGREENNNSYSNDVEWACGCFLCKRIAYPILRRFIKRIEREVEAEERAVEDLTVAQQSIQIATSTSTATPGESQENKEKNELNVELVVAKIVEELDKRVSAKISSIEKEVENVRKEFSAVVEELKNSIIEVRATVSELANPFNFMRRYADIVDESGKLLQLLTQLQQISEGGQQAQQSEVFKVLSQAPVSEELKMLLTSISATPGKQRVSALARVLRLIKWVDEHMVGIPREILEGVVSFALEAGLIGEKEKNLLLSAVRFVEEMRKRGIGIREQLVMLYSVVKMLGVEDKEADNEMLKMVMEEGRRG